MQKGKQYYNKVVLQPISFFLLYLSASIYEKGNISKNYNDSSFSQKIKLSTPFFIPTKLALKEK